MRFFHAFNLLLLLVLGQSGFALAQTDEILRDERSASVDEVAVFSAHYSRLMGGNYASLRELAKLGLLPQDQYPGIGDFLEASTFELVKKFSWCAEYGEDRTECIQDRFEKVVDQATLDGVLDRVEKANLKSFAPILIYRSEKIVTDISQYLPVNVANNRLKDNEIALPDLQIYLERKRKYEQMRVAAGLEKDYPPELIKYLTKKYPRKIHGVGRVDLIHFVLAKYDVPRLNTLSKQMKDARELALSNQAKVVFTLANGQQKEVPLHYDEIADLALCLLKFDLKGSASRSSKSFLHHQNPTIEDAAMAALITGDASLEVVSQLIQQKEFIEPNPKKGAVGRILADVAKTLLITQPQLITYYTIGSILIGAFHQKKEYESAAAKDTNFINCSL